MLSLKESQVDQPDYLSLVPFLQFVPPENHTCPKKPLGRPATLYLELPSNYIFKATSYSSACQIGFPKNLFFISTDSLMNRGHEAQARHCSIRRPSSPCSLSKENRVNKSHGNSEQSPQCTWFFPSQQALTGQASPQKGFVITRHP